MRSRETAEETRDFVAAILEGLRTHGVSRVLISIRDSRALFKIEDWKLSEAIDEAVRIGRIRVAFIADAEDVRMSQQYIALVGRQRGLDFEAFGSEQTAVAWLQAG